MKDIYILSAVRTAIGKFGGSLKNVGAKDLGTAVIKEVIKRAGVKSESVDEVIMGCVLTGGLGQNVARQCSVNAGIPEEVPAMTLNMVCGSGLRSVSLAAQTILSGENDLVVAGGTENMSAGGYVVKDMRWGARMGNSKMVDMTVNDGLTDAFNEYHMGITAENVAQKYGISRERQDDFAYQSQKKASNAQKNGRFSDEILPIEVPGKKGKVNVFDNDEFIRHEVEREGLQKLRPAFKKEGTVTAGNASGINDGAAALLISGDVFMQKSGVKPMAKILSHASVGVSPEVMGIGPINAVKEAVKKANLKIEDVDLFELNEAFASQSLAVQDELGVDPEKVNVNGGAIALGHPIGASGARILVTLLYEMKKRGVKYGVAGLCVGGGMGTAIVVESMN